MEHLNLFSQPELPIIYKEHNNSESAAQYKESERHFSGQCLVAYEAMKRGERLTQFIAATKYGIMDLRPRIATLIKLGVEVKKSKIEGGNGAKEFYL